MDLLVWYLIVTFFGVVGLPFSLYIFSDSGERGLGAARVIGLLIVGYLMWLGTSLGLFPTTASSAWLMLLLCSGMSLLLLAQSSLKSRLFRSMRSRHLLFSEFVFLVGFILFGVLRAYHPEIYWGEKPMDSTFVHYFARLETLPPDDPWFAGHAMRYYYVGFYLVGLIIKLSGVAPAVAYNLALPTLAAALLAVLYSLSFRLLRERGKALLVSSLVLVVSNFKAFELIWTEPKAVLDFNFFWATSRVFTTPAFTEYPIWTFLFADLHPHVIALPFVGLFLLGLHRLTRIKRLVSWNGFSIGSLMALCLAWLFVVNTWDFLGMGFLLGAAMVLTGVFRPGGIKVIRVVGRPLFGAIIILGSLVFMLPFYWQGAGGADLHWGLVQTKHYNELASVLIHFGLWFAAAALGMALWLVHRQHNPSSFWVFIVALKLTFLPLALGVIASVFGRSGVPWSTLSVVSILMFSALWFGERSAFRGRRFVALLIVQAGLLISLVELFYFMDRMNSVFKFYLQAWLLLGIAGGAVLVSAPKLRGSKLRRSLGVLGRGFAVAAIAAGLYGSAVNTRIILEHRRVDGPRPTLDGQAFLARWDQHDQALIEWINTNISGTPTLLEAQGPPYQDFSRIAMHTGLPTFLGWEYHVYQRGAPRSEIVQRRGIVEFVYRTGAPEQIAKALRSHEIDYVVVSSLEFRTYGRGVLQRFLTQPEHFAVVFNRGRSFLFAVRGRAGV